MRQTTRFAFSLAVLAAACSSSSSPSAPPVDTVAISQAQRVTSPNVPLADATALQEGNTAFAFDVYRSLRSANTDANVFFSPYSISLALAMTYAGARGATATEMAKALHFTLPDAQLHPGFDQLDLALASRGPVSVADSLWAASEAKLSPAFLDTLATSYGAGVRLTDFTQSEEARKKINGWVSEQTHDCIAELLPEGSIEPRSALVLVNAIYFRGEWQQPFLTVATKDATFHGPHGDVNAAMMHVTDGYPYAKGDGYQAIRLPYEAGLSFVAVLPEDDAAFEASLDGTKWAQVTSHFDSKQVQLSLPKVTIKGGSISLKTTLGDLGMPTAFTEQADLSGMSPAASKGGWHLGDVFHQAVIAVDEVGSEAAASTAVTVVPASIDDGPPTTPVVLTFDRPFVFAIRDDATGAILFLGHVTSPASP